MERKTSKPFVWVIGLGGTIVAMATNGVEPFYSASSLEIKDILFQLLAINDLATIQYETFCNISSHEISHEILLAVTKRIQNVVEMKEVDGIVIAVGTNALEEVAYFIDLLVRTAKPIVVTGAMRPANALGYDGARNLYNALVLASSTEAIKKGVLVTFNDSITSAQDTVKINPSVISDFSGNDFALLGYIHGSQPYFYRLPHEDCYFNNRFNLDQLAHFPVVYILYSHVGADNILVEAAVANGAQGIVCAGMGNGYLPAKMTLALAEACKKGVLVVRCPRACKGIAYFDVHTDDKYGFIPGGSLTPQKARILLAVALAHTDNKEEVRKIFSHNEREKIWK